LVFGWRARFATAHRMINRCGAKWQRRLLAILRDATGEPDVGRIVGADRRRHGTAFKEPLLNREQVARADAHQHDINQLLAGDFANVVAEFGEAAIRSGTGVASTRRPGRGQTEGHVGVFGVGEDEVAASRIGGESGKFRIQ
jgi:hypothetical protein